MTEHTPTPWRVEESLGEFYITADALDADCCIADVREPPNADFIVRAVNAHDELVAALRALMPLVSANSATLPKLDAARDAIARAEGSL